MFFLLHRSDRGLQRRVQLLKLNNYYARLKLFSFTDNFLSFQSICNTKDKKAALTWTHCLILSRLKHSISSGSSLLQNYRSTGISGIIVNYSGDYFCLQTVTLCKWHKETNTIKPLQELEVYFGAMNKSKHNEAKWQQESPRKLSIQRGKCSCGWLRLVNNNCCSQ